MKKSIKIIAVLAIALVTLFACKKDKEEVRKEERFSVGMKVATARGGTEAAILIGTKAELKAALTQKDGKVYLKKVSEKNNVFVPVVDGTVGPVDPVKPIDLCWKEIDAYYEANVGTWREQANQNCKDVVVCLTCPNAGVGLFVLYVIKPNSPKCLVLDAFEAQFSLSAFNFNNNQLDSEAVANIIKEK
ncbi:hypothetical protein [Pedobacter sp. UBA4863]|uniref:hypothetical protein n=1 Tax=Pedobacter sp. UBA4863 TaxID=1947060 RepID=UPI0025FEB4AA|nr:hypothetical protein [Pedobacter sp. UBA4863]